MHVNVYIFFIVIRMPSSFSQEYNRSSKNHCKDLFDLENVTNCTVTRVGLD